MYLVTTYAEHKDFLIVDIEKLRMNLHLEGIKLLTKSVTGTGVKRLRNSTYKISLKEEFKRIFSKRENMWKDIIVVSLQIQTFRKCLLQ